MPPSSSQSIPTDEVLSIIKKHIEDADKVQQIARDLFAVQKELAEEKKAAAGGPKRKNNFVIVIRGDDSVKRAVEAGAYVLTVPNCDSETETTEIFTQNTLVERIKKAVKVDNDLPKAKRGRYARKASHKITTFVSAMENLRTKAIKQAHQGPSMFTIKTRAPVPIIVVGDTL